MGARWVTPQGVRVLDLHLQEPLHAGEHVQPMIVRVAEPLPGDIAESELVYEQDARQLADALWESLPGGTIDRLIVQLMERRTSLFWVGFLSAQEIADLARARRERTGRASGSQTEAPEPPCAPVGTPAVSVPREGASGQFGEWVESRHDWGDPDRCRFWARGARCYYRDGHDVIGTPHDDGLPRG